MGKEMLALVGEVAVGKSVASPPLPKMGFPPPRRGVVLYFEIVS